MNDVQGAGSNENVEVPGLRGTAGLKPFGFSQRTQRTKEQPIGYLMSVAVENQNIISLAAGLVDYETLPTGEVLEIATRVLSEDQAKIALQYGTTEGHARLRQVLLNHFTKMDGVPAEHYGVTADDVVVTTGSQQLLFILTDVLVDPGDIVITCWPSYFVYTGALATFGAEVHCVDIDEDGMIPEKLEGLLSNIEAQGKLDRVKIVYSVDYHQNPTGITLAEERREAVFEIVKKYSNRGEDGGRILLLEDSAYRELTYEGEAPKSIKRYDRENAYVASLYTFSKPFSPGLKTGYGILPRELVEPVILQKGNHDFGSVNFAQHLLLGALESGMYDTHVEKLCKHYAGKRDAMLKALETHLGGMKDVSWTRPTGGLYVWLTLPVGADTRMNQPLFNRAVQEGMIYVPGDFCFCGDPSREIPRNHMRLSFGTATEENIRLGIERLAIAIKAVVG